MAAGAAAGAVVVLVAGQQLGTLGRTDLLGEALTNAAHIPLFALLTLLLYQLLGRPRWSVLLLAALLLALGTEALQVLTDRQPSLYDIGLDLLGIVPVIAALQLDRRLRRGRGASRRWRRGVWWGAGALIVLMAAAVPARVLTAYLERDALFPRLLVPEARALGPLIDSNGPVRLTAAPTDWPGYAGRDVLELRWAQVRYPGLTLLEVVPDWHGFTELEVDVYLPDGPAMALTAAIGHLGTPGTARYQRRLIAPGAARVRYDLAHLLAPLDDQPVRVTRLILHASSADAGRRLLVGEVRLVSGNKRAGAIAGTLAPSS